MIRKKKPVQNEETARRELEARIHLYDLLWKREAAPQGKGGQEVEGKENRGTIHWSSGEEQKVGRENDGGELPLREHAKEKRLAGFKRKKLQAHEGERGTTN